MNLEQLWNKRKNYIQDVLTTNQIVSWFQSDASEFLKLEGIYEEILEKYRKTYFHHVQEGMDEWALKLVKDEE